MPISSPFLRLLCFLFAMLLSAPVMAQRWADSLDKYRRTSPQLAAPALAHLLERSDLPDTIRFDMLTTIVVDYGQLGQPESALTTAKEAYQLAELLKDDSRLTKAALSMAWTLRDFGRLDEVLEKTLEAERLSKKTGDTRMQIYAANTLASVYYDLGEDSLQTKHLEQACALTRDHQIVGAAISAMSNLGYIYLNQKRYREALNLFFKVIAFERQQAALDFRNLDFTYNHILDVYEILEQYDSCQLYLDTLIMGVKQVGWKDKVVLYQNLKNYYAGLAGKSVDPEPWLTQLNQIDPTGYGVDVHKEVLWEQGRLNNWFGNYKAAIAYQQKYHALMDSLNNADLRKKIAFYKERFDANERERQIADLQTEAELERIKTEQEKARTKLLLLGLTVVLGLSAALVFFFFRVRQARNELQQLNAVKDRLFAIISHDLRNSVTAFEGMGEVIQAYINKQRWERLARLGQKLDSESAAISHLLNNLLNWSLQQLGRFQFQPESLGLQSKLEETQLLFAHQIEAKNLTVDLEVSPAHQAWVDSNVLALVLRNLLGNAIKYSKPGGHISCISKVEHGEIQLSFADEGVGMSRAQLEALQRQQNQGSQTGTQGEKGTGLGLALVQEFLAKSQGRLHISSESQKGSTFTVFLPTK
ncbi:MAG: ATP-binding protein [Salibacteraceae bacterium]